MEPSTSPENDDNVQFNKRKLKADFCALRDYLIELRNTGNYDNRALSVAITELDTSQMWAVRSLFSDEEVRNH